MVVTIDQQAIVKKLMQRKDYFLLIGNIGSFSSTCSIGTQDSSSWAKDVEWHWNCIRNMPSANTNASDNPKIVFCIPGAPSASVQFSPQQKLFDLLSNISNYGISFPWWWIQHLSIRISNCWPNLANFKSLKIRRSLNFMLWKKRWSEALKLQNVLVGISSQCCHLACF